MSVQNPGYGQSVATVITRAAKNVNRVVNIRKMGMKPIGKRKRRPFHQVNGGDGLVGDGVGVPLAGLLSVRYYHGGQRYVPAIKIQYSFFNLNFPIFALLFLEVKLYHNLSRKAG